MIKRSLSKNIQNKLGSGKVLLVIGARQTGKTTLLEKLFKNRHRTLWLNADETDVQQMFEKASSTRFKTIFGKNKTIIIDEAQRIKDIGLKLKLITDQLKDVQVIVTGSSAFELSNKLNEPLTGRKWEYYLYPLSYAEMVAHNGLLEEKRLLQHRLIYGYYPEIVMSAGEEKPLLKQLTDSYLYKDILMWERLKKTEKLLKLLQALALQLGSEVSYNELSKLVGIDNQTIEKYILLLEQTFVIFRLNAFNRNLRSELKRGRKIFFYDNGVRNALIANFNEFELRVDKGALWENFLIAERMKYINYQDIWTNRYFWRTKDQQEIDYLEEKDGKLYAYEFKWNTHKKTKIPPGFAKSYDNYKFSVITPDNFEEFLGIY